MKKKRIKVLALLCGLTLMSGMGVSAAESVAPRQSGNFYQYHIDRFQKNNYLPGARKVTDNQYVSFKATKIDVTERLEVWSATASQTQISENYYINKSDCPMDEAKDMTFTTTTLNSGSTATAGWQNANWSGNTGKVDGWVNYQ